MATDLATLLVRALAPVGDDADATEARILDAARDEVAAQGTRGATIDDVAARAGVGRITVFRRFGSKPALLERMYVRELRRFLADVDERITPIEDPVERIVEAFAACLAVALHSPLGRRLTQAEPGATLRALEHGEPSPYTLARAFVADRIADAQRTGDLPPERDPVQTADLLIRLALSYTMLPTDLTDLADERQARDFARAAIAPLATG